MDVSALKSEIKSWEHEFRSNHGRDPTIQEIKDQPAIAEKYKLYKKLSKASVSTDPPSNNPVSPSTPPTSLPRTSTSSILPKARAVKIEASLLTSNPFSPVKNKGKQKYQLASSTLPHISQVNPFATPSKAKSKPHVRPRVPSPDPFPPIQPIQLAQPSQSLSHHHTPSTATIAVSRARKRLRGEPVSPSPVKEKRARVGTQSTLTFTRRNSLLPDGDASDGDGNTGPEDVDDSPFLDDSPMKPPAGGKAFIQLFDEAPAKQDLTKRPLIRSQSRKKPAANGLFGPPRGKSRAVSPESGDDNTGWEGGGKIEALNLSLNGNNVKTKLRNNPLPKAMLPGKDDLWSTNGPTKNSSSIAPSKAGPSQSAVQRPSSDHETTVNEGITLRSITRLSLLPPSPPPPDAKPANPRYIDKGKGKAAASINRKKSKLLGEIGGDGEDEDSPEDEDMNVKIVEWSWNNRHRHTQDDPSAAVQSEEDWDPTLHRPHPPDGVLLPTEVDPGVFEVNLPDELKRVLELEPDESKVREHTERKLAKELLYGSREMHYDARKGGEIWDVGEEGSGEGEVIGEEEDWEGEPVPWEVGEL